MTTLAWIANATLLLFVGYMFVELGAPERGEEIAMVTMMVVAPVLSCLALLKSQPNPSIEGEESTGVLLHKAIRAKLKKAAQD